jgi:hypothetical protein
MVLSAPHRAVGRLQGVTHHPGQIVTDRVQFDRVHQPGRKHHHRVSGIITGPVEAAIHQLLHPAAQRIEQRAAISVMMPARPFSAGEELVRIAQDYRARDDVVQRLVLRSGHEKHERGDLGDEGKDGAGE